MIILAKLILINGVFASAEIALVSVNRNKVKLKVESGDKNALKLKEKIDDPSKFLATVQIGISLIGLFSGAFAAQSFSPVIVKFLVNIGIQIPPAVLAPVVVLIISLVLSYFTLVFGELVPKRLGMKKANTYAYMIVGPLGVLSTVVTPFVKILSISTDFLLKMVGINTAKENDDVTEEEIRLMMDAGTELGNIDERELVMINNIFEFDNHSVGEIATHRTDVVALSVNDSVEEVLKVLATEKYTRFPVYDENIDNIVGILNTKDVMKYIINFKSLEAFSLRDIMYEPFFSPISKKTDELFKEMQKNKSHISVIIDEYGGTYGIVTMEDLVEEIMGSILDEFDEEEVPDIIKIDETTYAINGTTELDTINDYFDIELPVDEYDTLSGFLIGQLGHIPLKEEQPDDIEYEGLRFKVTSTEDNRISSVTFSRIKSDE